jgi:hypothetical protein
MGGVVFATGSVTLGRYGKPTAFGAGAVIPAGIWILGGGYTVTTGGSTLTCSAGYCISDGVSVTATAATTGVSVGA